MQAMMTIGRISRVSVRAPERIVGAEAHQPDEQRQPEDPVDDRRDAGEVADVRLEQAVEAAVTRVLREVDRGATPIGNARSPTMIAISIDPTSAGRIPACAGRRDGTAVRKSAVEPRQALDQDVGQEQEQREQQDHDRHEARSVEDRARRACDACRSGSNRRGGRRTGVMRSSVDRPKRRTTQVLIRFSDEGHQRTGSSPPRTASGTGSSPGACRRG